MQLLPTTKARSSVTPDQGWGKLDRVSPTHHVPPFTCLRASTRFFSPCTEYPVANSSVASRRFAVGVPLLSRRPMHTRCIIGIISQNDRLSRCRVLYTPYSVPSTSQVMERSVTKEIGACACACPNGMKGTGAGKPAVAERHCPSL